MNEYNGSKKLFSVSAMNNLFDNQKRELQGMIDEIKKKPILRIPSQKGNIMDLVNTAKNDGYKFGYVPQNGEMMLVKKLRNQGRNYRDTEDGIDSIDILSKSGLDFRKKSGRTGEFFSFRNNSKKLK